jgi:hypothetical protein
MSVFVDFSITWRAYVFSGAPQSSSAANFVTVGINFRARKPADEAEWVAALAALNCELPPTTPPTSKFGADSFYDAGDTGCAFGPIDEIAALMRQMNPGQTLEVRATDPNTRGRDDLERASLAFVVGNAALTAGQEATVLLGYPIDIP